MPRKIRKCVDEISDEREYEIRLKIKELKGKIKMKEEKRLSSEVEKNKSTIAENERNIAKMRLENCDMRRAVRRAIDMDHILVSEVLVNRKRERLALAGKTSDAAIREIDQTVCDLARKLNDLVHKRHLKTDKITKLENKMNRRPCITFSNSDEAMRLRQLENAINKVELKTSTAFSVMKVYKNIEATVKDELRVYPMKLNQLEKQFFCQRKEREELNTMHKKAMAEKEIALISKARLEQDVRNERRERDAMMRHIHAKVKEATVILEMPSTTKRTTRHGPEGESPLSEIVRRTEKRLEAIKEYRRKAEMLEIVTGIPFVNEDNLVNCLRNQLESSKYLNRYSKESRRLLEKNRALLDILQQEHNQQKYEHNKGLEIKTMLMEKAETDVKELIKKQKEQISLLKQTLSEVNAWLAPMTTRLLQTLNPLSKGTKVTTSTNIALLFEMFKDLLADVNRVSDEKVKKLGIVLSPCTDLDQFPLDSKDDEKIIHGNNNRILAKLEKKISEDFDYNTPNNDEYISRMTIKRQAESRQRGKRMTRN